MHTIFKSYTFTASIYNNTLFMHFTVSTVIASDNFNQLAKNVAYEVALLNDTNSNIQEFAFQIRKKAIPDEMAGVVSVTIYEISENITVHDSESGYSIYINASH